MPDSGKENNSKKKFYSSLDDNSAKVLNEILDEVNKNDLNNSLNIKKLNNNQVLELTNKFSDFDNKNVNKDIKNDDATENEHNTLLNNFNTLLKSIKKNPAKENFILRNRFNSNKNMLNKDKKLIDGSKYNSAKTQNLNKSLDYSSEDINNLQEASRSDAYNSFEDFMNKTENGKGSLSKIESPFLATEDKTIDQEGLNYNYITPNNLNKESNSNIINEKAVTVEELNNEYEEKSYKNNAERLKEEVIDIRQNNQGIENNNLAKEEEQAKFTMKIYDLAIEKNHEDKEVENEANRDLNKEEKEDRENNLNFDCNAAKKENINSIEEKINYVVIPLKSNESENTNSNQNVK